MRKLQSAVRRAIVDRTQGWGSCLPWALAGLTPVASVLAAPGDLDPSFGDHGRVHLASAFDFANGAATALPDGRLVLAESNAGGAALYLVRLLANGQPDAEFGPDGRVSVDLGGHPFYVTVMSTSTDGRLLLGGTWPVDDDSQDIAIMAFAADGTPDSTFGTGGRTVVALETDSLDDVYDMQIAADGDILLAGSSQTDRSRLALARLNPDGTPDEDFGDAGVSVYQGIHAGFGKAVRETVDGKLLACGTGNDTAASDPFMLGVLFDGSGAIDASFGDDGILHGPAGFANDCAIDSNARILLAGRDRDGLHGRIARFTASGAVDQSFGDAGVVDEDFECSVGCDSWYSSSWVNQLALLPDGRIALGGINLGFEPAAALLSQDGRRVESFGQAGATSVDIGAGDVQSYTYEVTMLQQDEHLILATFNAGKSVIARLQLEDRPGASVVGFAYASGYATEGDGSLELAVRRSGSQQGEVSVQFRTADVDARAGEDFEPVTGILTWADGDSDMKYISLPVVDDGVAENSESLQVLLESPLDAGLAISTMYVGIGDPPPPPPPEPEPEPDVSSGGGGTTNGALAGLLALLGGLFRYRRANERTGH